MSTNFAVLPSKVSIGILVQVLRHLVLVIYFSADSTLDCSDMNDINANEYGFFQLKTVYQKQMNSLVVTI